MAFNPSPEQKLAIETVGSNLLVSAGAGSGKTAVLTERIVYLMKKGTPITRFLVLTFTNEAVNEMKSRLRKLISEDSSLSGQVNKVDEAHIETFDALCLYLVKKYHTDLNINQDVNIISQAVLSIKQNDIIREVMDELYEKEDPAFLELISTFCFNNDNNILELIVNLQKATSLYVDKEAYYQRLLEEPYRDENMKAMIVDLFKHYREVLQTIHDAALELEYQPDREQILDFINHKLSIKDYDELRLELLDETHQFPRKKSPGKGESPVNDGDFRTEIGNLFKKIAPSYKDTPDYGSSEEIINIFKNNQRFAKVIIDISREVDRRLDDFKNRINCYSYDDIARKAIYLIDNPEIRKEVSDSFDYILVDEYQDTSNIQDYIIGALGKDNIYMVGDVKQSIYRFRKANPVIFQEKYDKYRVGDGGQEIGLNKSYRSRESVVNFINDIFSQLMRKEFNPIDYQNGHNFEYGQKAYDELISTDNYEPEIYLYDLEEKAKNADRIEKEIQLIAEDIITKINNHYQVYDKDLKVLRDVSFKDFAIIIDRGTNFQLIKETLLSYGVPTYVFKDEKITSNMVTNVIKNLAKLYDKMLDANYDKEYEHAFVSVARSFLVQMSDRNIYDAVTTRNTLNVEFTHKIELLQEKIRYFSIYDTLKVLLDEFDVFNKLFLMDDYNKNNHIMQFILEESKGMDLIGYSFKDFVNYFDDLDKNEIEISYEEEMNHSDCVSIMTIHKSKGLEFPICYFPILFTKFNTKEQETSFLVSDKYGILFPNCLVNGITSLAAKFYKDSILLADFEEKIRLFYVALTRAREKIIMFAPNVETKQLLDFTSANSFIKFMAQINMMETYGVIKEVSGEISLIREEEIKDSKREFILTPLDLEYEEVVPNKRASKVSHDDADEEVLLFGIRIHYYLEIVDYETKNTHFIKNHYEKGLIDNVLAMDIFKDVKNDEVLHEYEYFDEINDIHGIIDCLIIKDDEIKIIDFKLKHLDDEAYQKQLETYRDYIKTIAGNKKVTTYLLSVMDNTLKEVF